MLDFSDPFDAFVDELNDVLTLVPFQAKIVEGIVTQIYLQPISWIADDDQHIAELAEHLRMTKCSTNEVREIETDIKDVEKKYGIQVMGKAAVTHYIDRLTGEMSIQEAFPNRAPYWRLHYVDADDSRSVE